MIPIPEKVKLFEGGVKVLLDPIDPDITVSLFLPEIREYRFAGNFNPDDGILFLKRFSRHRHAILNAFGVSAYVIETLEPLGLKMLVLFVEDTREYFEISLGKAQIEGVYKFWKERGFDRQLFVPIPLWEKKR